MPRAMRHLYNIQLLVVLILATLAASCSTGASPAGDGATRREDGKNIHNPVAATPESIATGKKLYDKLCADCHGANADGISQMAANMPEGEKRPPNLVDDLWDHGSTDGDIFVGIRDGVGGGGAMKGLNGRPGVGPTEMWNMVNYVRSLAVARSHEGGSQ
jgi:mono/diheme cytochrome c family protein